MSHNSKHDQDRGWGIPKMSIALHPWLVDLLVTQHGVVIATEVVALITLVPLNVEVNHIPVIFKISVILGLESTLGTY